LEEAKQTDQAEKKPCDIAAAGFVQSTIKIAEININYVSS